MILASPNSILFDFGAIKIYYYGLIMAISIIIGILVCKFVCKKIYSDVNFDFVYNLATGAIISGLIGARLYYVIAANKYFSKHLTEIFAIQNGGMSIHGAILGGLIFSIIYLNMKKLHVLKYLDILSFGIISGQIIGRWGNFFNSEAFGIPTNLPLKLFIPIEKRPLEFINFEYFHPTFLYESFLNLLALIILFFIAKKVDKNGYVFFSYILIYSIIRLFVEQLRIDSVLNISGIPIAQVISVLGILTGLIGIISIKFSNKEKIA